MVPLLPAEFQGRRISVSCDAAARLNTPPVCTASPWLSRIVWSRRLRDRRLLLLLLLLLLGLFLLVLLLRLLIGLRFLLLLLRLRLRRRRGC